MVRVYQPMSGKKRGQARQLQDMSNENLSSTPMTNHQAKGIINRKLSKHVRPKVALIRDLQIVSSYTEHTSLQKQTHPGMATSLQEKSTIVAKTEEFVKSELANNDGSHDFHHIDRVRNTALSLAKEENIPTDKLLIVELAALLHDIQDWKYSGKYQIQTQIRSVCLY